MKTNIIITTILIFMTSTGLAEKPNLTTQPSHSISHMETKAEYLLKNTRGWQIKVPANWEISPIAGANALTDPIVEITSMKSLVKGKPSRPARAYGITIDLNEQSLHTSVESRISNRIEQNELKKTSVVKIKSNDSTYDGFANYTIPIGDDAKTPSGITWNLYGFCNNVDLSITLWTLASREELKKPLKDQKLPKQLQDMFDTFECK